MRNELSEIQTRVLELVRRANPATAKLVQEKTGYTYVGALYLLHGLKERGLIREAGKIGQAIQWQVMTSNGKNKSPMTIAVPGQASAILEKLIKCERELWAVNEEMTRMTEDKRRRREELEHQIQSLKTGLLKDQPTKPKPPSKSHRGDVAAQVLRVLQGKQGGLSVKEMAELTKLGNAQVRGSLASLLRHKKLKHLSDGRYELRI